MLSCGCVVLPFLRERIHFVASVAVATWCLLALQAPYLPNDYVATVAAPALALTRLPKESEAAPVFCALHHVWKMDETIFGVWMEVLRAVPHSRLRLQECAESAKETLRSIAVSVSTVT